MFLRRDAVHVSLAYRYHHPQWDLVKNQRYYGTDHSAAGIGANMKVWLEIAGSLDSGSRLLASDVSFSPHLQKVKELLDHRCLFEVESWFKTRVPTLENITLFICEKLTAENPPGGRWYAVEIEENSAWRCKVLAAGAPLRLVHSFRRDDWKIEAEIAGEVDPESGLLQERAAVTRAILSTPFRDPDAFFHELQKSIPRLAALSCKKHTGWAYEIA